MPRRTTDRFAESQPWLTSLCCGGRHTANSAGPRPQLDGRLRVAEAPQVARRFGMDARNAYRAGGTQGSHPRARPSQPDRQADDDLPLLRALGHRVGGKDRGKWHREARGDGRRGRAPRGRVLPDGVATALANDVAPVGAQVALEISALHAIVTWIGWVVSAPTGGSASWSV